MLTLFTGMRIGETCAPKWADIDFDERILHVTKTVQRIATFGTESKSAVKVTAPKSESSVRDIPLPDFLVDMLRGYRGKDTDYRADKRSCIFMDLFSFGFAVTVFFFFAPANH